MQPRIKICGARRGVDIAAIRAAGADYVGLMLEPRSPRFLETQVATQLRALCTQDAPKPVAVVQWPVSTATIGLIRSLRPHALQIHGSAPHGWWSDALTIAHQIGCTLWIASGIRSPGDAEMLTRAPECAFILCDAPPPRDTLRLGGWGTTFDWRHLDPIRRSGRRFGIAGGLNPDNVAEAMTALRPHLVDVSSGVERQRGVKDAHLIRQFARAVRDGISDARNHDPDRL